MDAKFQRLADLHRAIVRRPPALAARPHVVPLREWIELADLVRDWARESGDVPLCDPTLPVINFIWSGVAVVATLPCPEKIRRFRHRRI